MTTEPEPSLAAPVTKRRRRASFLDIFVSQAEIDKLRRELHLRQERKKAASATPPAATAAAADPAPEAPKPPESANPAVGTAQAPFTPAEDVALLSLKAQNKTWKEIGDVLVGRDKDELRNRYKEIGGANGGGGSEAAKEDNGAAAAAQSNEGKGKQGKQKGDGGKKGKGKQGENKAEDTKDAPAATAAAAPTVTPAAPINAKEAVVANKNNAKIKGILRRGSDGAFQIEDARIPEGASTLNGSPIIYLDENDPLDIEELSFLYNMNCAFEEQRWIRMASKFFDQTGKRIEPEWLKEKLKNCMQ